ncbi:MAG: chromosome segregation protein SMC [Alphaproteobacteria bacterium]|nr:chromosome segregation protein SMC [Alphaproteobacteria bacterium]
MIQFTKLRITGFKSFVERTELDIDTGLTGIVGPNGCGKSNLVEALRWVMGESSAKRMRGGGMDDVIFAGTSSRPPRSLAEVSLVLDNSSKTAPAAFNKSEEIEVSRKIQRDQGSSYRINGQLVRAHDVHLLFADVMSGANSPALVSQGQITRIITAKPVERRLILEESAGISGLYARRHEAELRLRSADANLVRIEDVLGNMESRLAALKKQARQASRYRNISAQVRQLDIMLAWLEWRVVHEKLKETRQAFDVVESRVAERTTAVVQLTKTQATQARDLPDLRQRDAEVSAQLQTYRIQLERMEDEVRQAETLLKETRDQLSQCQFDRKHELASLDDIGAQLERIETEHAAIVAEQRGESEELAEKQKARDLLEATARRLDSEHAALMESAADLRARREAADKRLASDRSLLEASVRKIATARDSLLRQERELEQDDRPATLRGEISDLEARLEDAIRLLEQRESERKSLGGQIEAARESAKESERTRDTLRTEISTLEQVLNITHEGAFRPVLDDMTVREGFEAALSKALGDSLSGSIDSQAPTAWLGRQISGLPALPEGCVRLADHIRAPAELGAALSQIGIVETEEQGEQLRTALIPGQSLVTREGAFWRWDGLYIKAAAIDRNAVYLQQKNKLADLQARLPKIESHADAASDAFSTLQEKDKALGVEISRFASERAAASNALDRARRELARALESRSGKEKDMARVQESLTILEEERVRLENAIKEASLELETFREAGIEERYAQIESMRARLSEVRDELRAAVRACDLCRQQQESRKARLHAIADERVNLQNRAIRSKERLKTLEERETNLQDKLKNLEGCPMNIQAGKQELLDIVFRTEAQRSVTAQKLAACEHELGETSRALRSAEAELGKAREERASVHAMVAAGQQRLEEVRAGIVEKFEVEPNDLPAHAALDVERIAAENLDEIRTRRERLIRERDTIGPVNLRAEVETQELERELAGLLNERNDLLQAITELRGGINKLNSEARQRLSAAFEHVNAHFKSLFTRLYGGGTAHLALIESVDLLEAGLEIYAQPPGKSLQSMTLLSGGEQTLASIALIFAMFLTNPSPICVLDEIDAPLDDANVDRVCDLLDEIAESGKTRFLIITHHRLTMARMDRLYGVTMAERGVSQLVSVDLQQSFEFMEAA